MAQPTTLKRMLNAAINMFLMDQPASYKRFPRQGVLNRDWYFSQVRTFTSSPMLRKKTAETEYFGFIAERNTLGFSDQLYGSYEQVSPQLVSQKRDVPVGISIPDYCTTSTGLPLKPKRNRIDIKSNEDLVRMRESCRLARHVLDKTMEQAQVGVTTDELDRFAHYMILKNKAYPSALMYKKFPKSICTSVNNVACHGIPDNRRLLNGDIISLDIMVYKNGFHGDCAATQLVGRVDDKGKTLVRVAEMCMVAGILQCGPGKPFHDIGKVIDHMAHENGMSVLHTFSGHGVGRDVHEFPDVFHYDRGVDDPTHVMKPGMTFTIEPAISQGMDMVRVLSDGWSAVTLDGARAAQFEHTVLITEVGVEILTQVIDRNEFV